MTLSESFFTEYLETPGTQPAAPGRVQLTSLVSVHLAVIPFENISKLYYLKKYDLKGIPEPERYLEGGQRYHYPRRMRRIRPGEKKTGPVQNKDRMRTQHCFRLYYNNLGS